MKQIFFFFILSSSFLLQTNTYASPGDTTRVMSHNAEHLGGYGAYDRWAVFPSPATSYYKILMRFTLGCPGTGCSEWDYTTQVFIRHRTGQMDSNLVHYPSFTVNGQTQDSLWYSNSATYDYFWDTANAQLDSAINPVLNVVLFNDPQNPGTPTGNLSVYIAGYYDVVYDDQGNFYDSIYIAADSVLYLQTTSVYNVFEVIENIEIGRMITPYAGQVPNSFKWLYTFDVTDYRPFLTDSAEIRVFYSGYQDGFAVTLDFEFVEGTPLHETYAIHKFYEGSFPYGNANDPIENYLTDKPLAFGANTDYASFRYWVTGHGFGGNENCAEFCPKNYYLKVNGSQVASNLIWNSNCGLNPLYPQAGTWIYDRSNWCPGMRVYPFDHNITSSIQPGDTAQLNIDMQPFTNINNNFCSYTISGQVFEYGPAAWQNDAEMLEIIAPNKEDKNFGRMNPVCDHATVIIRNTGANALTSLDIQYGIENQTMTTYNWTGNLPFLATDTVELPNLANWSAPNGLFFAANVSNPNGQQDEYSYNNFRKVSYTIPPVYPDSFLLIYKTNLAAYENKMYIKDVNGNIIFQRTTHSNNTIYKDTLHLAPGCYIFEFTDSDNDGITWWANSDGSGYVRFQKIATNTQIIRNFQQDFGSRILHHFTTGGYLDSPEVEAAPGKIEIYPNPSDNVFNVTLPVEGNMQFAIMDASGRVVKQGEQQVDDNLFFSFGMQGFAPGIYFIRIDIEGNTYSDKLWLTGN